VALGLSAALPDRLLNESPLPAARTFINEFGELLSLRNNKKKADSHV
jgi:hypothetical protein